MEKNQVERGMMAKVNEPGKCPECGAPKSGWLEDNCPSCLLRLGAPESLGKTVRDNPETRLRAGIIRSLGNYGVSAAAMRISREEKELGRNTNETIDAGLRCVTFFTAGALEGVGKAGGGDNGVPGQPGR